MKAKTIKKNKVTIASRRDSETFFDLLVNPAPPNEALKAAALAYILAIK